MGFLREALVALTFPLALTLAGLLLAAVVWRLRWRRTAMTLAVLALGWSAVWSVPRNSEWLRQSLEDRHASEHERALPTADAIVVLGGGGYTWVSRPGVTIDDLKYSRLAAGARLFLADRAPRVILSGGGVGKNTEARNMARGMQVLGVPQSALLLEEKSHDTDDNARYVGMLAREQGVHRILLVTSAVHMPRASLLFRRNGMEVFEVPVPEPTLGGTWADQWIPSGRALWRSGRALKEYAGLVALCLGADKPA
ncbi:membrane protein [Lysobacter helvus]|uniref:Membrane protein n=2 Tax=Lysobacteraceae TaxID=32033 RepID=A0ABN6FUE6_9GAMM|nr:MULTISPECIES: YdcF family protein [Lysobacter]BCT93326.1 membrane protein [Lysobacter caseinilyticus]BCT96479.1 membrane protein [Lysobacter helvus]